MMREVLKAGTARRDGRCSGKRRRGLPQRWWQSRRVERSRKSWRRQRRPVASSSEVFGLELPRLLVLALLIEQEGKLMSGRQGVGVLGTERRQAHVKPAAKIYTAEGAIRRRVIIESRVVGRRRRSRRHERRRRRWRRRKRLGLRLPMPVFIFHIGIISIRRWRSRRRRRWRFTN